MSYLRSAELRDNRQDHVRDPAPPFGLALTPLPRQLKLAGALMPLERAVAAASVLQARLGILPFGENMTRVESRLDALALNGAGHTGAALLRLMVVEASHERPPPRDLRAVVRTLDAFRHGHAAVQAGGRSALTSILLGELHRLLRDEPSAAASPRSDLLRHGRPMSRLQPAEDRIRTVLHDLEQFLTNPPPLPLVVRTALAVARVEQLAPFGEDSAAMSRLLVPLMALAEGRPPVFLARTLAARRIACEAGLDALQQDGGWESWISFFLSCLADAADAASARLERAEQLRLACEADIVSLRSDSTARRLAQLAFGFPVLTVSAAQEMLDVSFQTANAAVATLVRLGLLTPYSSIRRNRIFVFAESLSMLAEAGPPDIGRLVAARDILPQACPGNARR